MPRIFMLLLVLYTGLLAGANPARADVAAAEALRDGSLKRLLFADPVAVGDGAFTDPAGDEHRLADYQGKWLLVNFWATWCAPCRKEMPGLNALQAEFGGDRFQVLTIATGPNPLPAVQRFMKEVEADELPILLDPNQALARQMGVLGLPLTVLVDPEGREVARLIGDADWSGESARAIVAELLAD
ncbi:TlpA family protein disulfide reductase [Frigidibacter sp. ROC022]|uniref:TlpA family protein disulfide reductase n=1 Tax=Frigidibacter sp. ROC022 TaxID=2971796 RepID=UPI00215B2F84|nr:TlpA disulfide reductase family protein [Frigidibacter sp. ROC022]MCR8724905.1 TlpA family protein disulfide reductase [Frigidibacter sp. ROC022]